MKVMEGLCSKVQVICRMLYTVRPWRGWVREFWEYKPYTCDTVRLGYGNMSECWVFKGQLQIIGKIESGVRFGVG